MDMVLGPAATCRPLTLLRVDDMEGVRLTSARIEYSYDNADGMSSR